MHNIKNNFLSVGVKSKGAELCSLKNLVTNTEYIWQADPEIWSSHAPNLFPVIGVLKNGEYFFEGKSYKMPKHGFIRNNNDIKLREKTENSLLFSLEFSEESLKIYPFKFRFDLKFTLEKKKLTISHIVVNLDEKPLFFSLGGHPAFNAPLYKDEVYEDYYLEFDKKMNLQTQLLSDNKLVSGQTKTIGNNTERIELHKNLFNNDALIFKEIASKKVALKSRKSGTILIVEYEDFQNLGIWAKPGASYVCIEPWLGIADIKGTSQQLKNKEGIIEIIPSENFKASYSITIE